MKLSIARNDKDMVELMKSADQQTLAVWAIDCVQRVMPYFDAGCPDDPRPRQAIQALRNWLKTGVFRMSDIRKASLNSHAAARDVGEDSPARSVARAAGQAVATSHVPSHSIGAAIYAQQAVHRATDTSGAEAAVAKEREWQYTRLQKLLQKNKNSACIK